MTTREVIDAIREIMSQHNGGEAELLDALVSEADGWRMRLQELEDPEDEDE